MGAKIVENTKAGIDLAVEVLRSGGLVVCPTITNYVLVCDALDPEAIRRVFEVKKRHRVAPLSVVAPSLQAIADYVRIPAWFPGDALEHLLPGPIGFIFPQKLDFPLSLTCGLMTVAVTHADDQCLSLVSAKFIGPVAATSANLSGQGQIRVSLEKAIVDIGSGVDLVVDGGPTQVEALDTYSTKAATIIDCSLGRPYLCRDGVIPWIEVQKYLPTLDPHVDRYYQVMRERYPTFPELNFNHETLKIETD